MLYAKKELNWCTHFWRLYVWVHSHILMRGIILTNGMIKINVPLVSCVCKVIVIIIYFVFKQMSTDFTKKQLNLRKKGKIVYCPR